ncbi:MAG: phosphoenolpyruvate protein kinase [Gammaproteobacteria bacterium]|nr:MAG: phosphoenolpyruvate protein kinase [Gammaproteobacteria bacterium]
MATRGDIVSRASRTALVVGTLLIAINYGDALIGGTVSMWQGLKMALTVFVPYGVSTYSSVGALRAIARS